LNPDNAAFVEGSTPFKPPRASLFSCSTLFYVPFLLAGLLIIASSLREWYIYIQLHGIGISTQAEVTGRSIDDTEASSIYYLHVHFWTQEEREIESRAQVDETQYSHYHEGDAINIRYLPEDPGIVRADWESAGFPALAVFLTLFALVWNVMFWGLMISAVMQSRKMARLALGGEKLIGEIKSVSGASDEDGNYTVKIHYAFQSPTGTLLNGKEQYQRNDLRNTLPLAGTPITVFYHDDKTFMAL
jgi:hypothetical protein